MKKISWIMQGVMLASALWLSCSEEQPLEVPADPPPMSVVNVEATFDAGANMVRITWDGPDTSTFSFYRIYRTSDTLKTGGADTSELSFISDERRSNISKTKNSYMDVPALANTVYYYTVRTVRVDSSFYPVILLGDTVLETAYDTAIGDLNVNEIDTVKVGSEVSFNINYGDVFTVTDKCTLVVNDPAHKLTHVRFTQYSTRYWKKASGEKIQADVYNPMNPPSNAQLNQLIAEKWITSQGRLESSVIEVEEADFDFSDPHNVGRSFAIASAGTHTFPWTLKKGNGEKKVFAELTYADGSVGTAIVNDGIKIAPYRIKINFRNKMNSADETMRRGEVLAGDIPYTIYKPWVKFSISVFADTTILKDFDYWLVISDSAPNIVEDMPSNIYGWLETKPIQASLTGIGADHDDDKIYEYSIDTSTAEGRRNLAQMKRTGKSPQKDLAFKLTGDEKYNETCVPGSYWGPDPLWWNPNAKQLNSVQEVLDEGPLENYRKVRIMNKSFIYSVGKKEFMIVARFKGKYFNDVRLALSGSKVAQKYGPRSYFDLYQPYIVWWDEKNSDWVNNDCTVVSAFNYALNANSCTDGGQADIDAIDLIIAQKPDSMEWNLNFSNDPGQHDVTADTLSLEALYNLRHYIFPYEIKVRNFFQKNVRWDDINPGQWPSGKYIMGIVTRDEFGNEGFAPVNKEGTAAKLSNPWMVTVQTGK
ncbi:MAG: hypothetical protein GF350_07360 [Chitinivibrionales bacterium]|nr:hypothetical protein [Chitinivibrionales bacterium]